MRRLLLWSVLVVFSSPAFAKSDYLYKSPNKIDFVKLDKGSKKERKAGIRHPYVFGPEVIREILRGLHFSKKNILMKDIEDRRLFDERNVEFLAPYLIEAFKKANADQVVVVSYFTRESKFAVMNDRLTIFRASLQDDGLHFRFTKLYAKLMGDRTTKGAERTVREAQSIRVQLEPQPGQALISDDPTEVVFDLDYYLKAGQKGPLPEKRQILLQTHPKKATAPEGKDIRERLKELDRLKEEELITEKEYQKKRRELLKEL